MWNLRGIIVVILMIVSSCIFLPEFDNSAEDSGGLRITFPWCGKMAL